MVKAKQIKTWFLGTLIIGLIGLLVSYFYIDYELNAMYGSHVGQVDSNQFKRPQENILIRNVSIFSTDSLVMVPGQFVYISGGKIRSVDSISPAIDDAVILDGTGKYLIPGLIDSHAHLLRSPNDLLLYLANGVTGIREMTGTEQHLQWKADIIKGERPGPELFICSKKMNSYRGFKKYMTEWTQPVIAIDEGTEVAAKIKTLKSKGFDGLKIGTFLDREHYLMVSEQSREQGIRLVGHIPLEVSLEDLWQSNQKEVAHIEEFMKFLNREFGGYTSENAQEFLAYVQSRGNQLSKQIAAKGITVTSTLWLMQSFVRQKTDLPKLLSEVRLTYANTGLIEGTPITSRGLGWLPKVNIYRWPEGMSPKEKEDSKIYWQTYAKANEILLRSMVANGVTVLPGTDANCPVTVPGFSLHDELTSLQEAGMDPRAVLEAATKKASAWMGNNTGSIASGLDADLVLLSENPLSQIGNTRTIEGVISKGRWYPKETLDNMLRVVRERNNESRSISIDGF